MKSLINKWLGKKKEHLASPVALDGCVFTLISIDINKEIRCKANCCFGDKVTCNHHWPYEIRKGVFYATQVVLNVICTEANENGWNVYDGDLKLVDDHGYTYDGFVLCDEIRADIPHTCRSHDIPPYTQSNIIYNFNIPRNADIVGAIITKHSQSVRIQIKESDIQKIFSAEFYKQIKGETDSALKTQGHYIDSSQNDYLHKKLKDSLYKLKVDIYKRLNNNLLPTDLRKIEDQISNEIYEIELRIENDGIIDYAPYKKTLDDFKETIEKYRASLTAQKSLDIEKILNIKRVEDLHHVQPYVFEYICANAMEKQGYKNVRVTRQSNDRGIDIMCEKDGVLCFVQCKRYIGAVGTPDIQRFIGAIQTECGDRGIFVTTGTFTRSATDVAFEHNIELIDKYSLAEWLSLPEANIKENDIFES